MSLGGFIHSISADIIRCNVGFSLGFTVDTIIKLSIFMAGAGLVDIVKCSQGISSDLTF